MVLKMVAIECMVHMQQFHHPLSRSCMCGAAHNFDGIVTKIRICLDNGPRTSEFEFGPYWIYSVCGISNTRFDVSI